MRAKARIGLPLAACFAFPDRFAAQPNPFTEYMNPDASSAVAARVPGQEPLRVIAMEPAPRWFDATIPTLPAEELARRLLAVQAWRARGFSLNTRQLLSHGHRTRIGRHCRRKTRFRVLHRGHVENGAGPPPDVPGSWCNPRNRGLGLPPSAVTGPSRADA